MASSSLTWTVVVARLLVAVFALAQIAHAYPYAFFSNLQTCPAVPLAKGLPPPSLGPMKAWLQVVGKAKWFCVRGKPKFHEIHKAKVYEIGSLYFNNPQMFKALATRQVFAMEHSERPDLSDTTKLYPSRLFAFHFAMRGSQEFMWTESIGTDSDPVKADLGGPSQSNGRSQKQAFQPGRDQQGDKIASLPGSNSRASIGNNPDGERLVADAPVFGDEERDPARTYGRRSRQGDRKRITEDTVLPTHPELAPHRGLASNPKQNPSDRSMIASNQGQTGFTKLRRRSPQAPSNPPPITKEQMEKYMRENDPFGNEFFPNPYGDPNYEAKQWEIMQAKGDNRNTIPQPGYGHWRNSITSIAPNGKNLPLAHYFDEKNGVEVYRVNTVAGLPTENDCANLGREDGRFLYPTAYQLVFFRKGCAPGLGPLSQSPPLFCAPSHGECPRNVAELQTQHRRYLSQEEARKKPKPQSPFANAMN